MEILLKSIHIIAASFMVIVVLVQGGQQGGIGAAFGGGNSQGVFGASGATSLLGKLTYGAAAVFMTTSIILSVRMGNIGGDVGLTEKLKERAAATAPAENPADKKEEAPSTDENK